MLSGGIVTRFITVVAIDDDSPHPNDTSAQRRQRLISAVLWFGLPWSLYKINWGPEMRVDKQLFNRQRGEGTEVLDTVMVMKGSSGEDKAKKGD
ncbi:hypothetical protein TREES_T100011700 [Tupaia chinensis]|uniref:Uncharacterized protein n=1 Tax=Tupaia chinensis TaxID=246437 RepID=L9L5P4_TUPCH|nr:hypothetical protein TREES_T100011700 [Tupaia chinensis]